MIQDIYPHVYDNSWQERRPKPSDIVFGFDGNNVILKPDQTFFRYSELDQRHSFQYLFAIDDTAFFLTDIVHENVSSLNINIARNYDPQYLGFACVTAWQLYNWMRTSKFCGECSTRMIFDTKERAMRCPNCGNLVYPRINPAVIVAVLSPQNELLITQYAIRHGEYRHDALVAGYAEIGETIEQCVIREVKEETGLDVTNLRYYKSQPWSFSSSLLFGFFCDAETTKVKIDRRELKSAVWKKPDDPFDVYGTASLTSEMIAAFQEGKYRYGL